MTIWAAATYDLVALAVVVSAAGGAFARVLSVGLSSSSSSSSLTPPTKPVRIVRDGWRADLTIEIRGVWRLVAAARLIAEAFFSGLALLLSDGSEVIGVLCGFWRWYWKRYWRNLLSGGGGLWTGSE